MSYSAGGSSCILCKAPTPITGRFVDGQGTPLRHFTETQLGLTLGIGLGMDDWDGCFRLGHMGHVNAQMVMAMLGGVETALAALNITRGKGALEAAAATLAA